MNNPDNTPADIETDYIKSITGQGGPAFPSTMNLPSGAQVFSPGMCLRDWFAGQALPAVIEVCRNDNRTSFAPESIEDYFARQAYAIADAMLAARSKGDQT